MSTDIQDILDFWYAKTTRAAWFNSTPAMDADIRTRFFATWERARDGGLDHWCDSATGCLALAIVLDQFPLNMFRGQAQSFATESKAVQVALHALERGFDRQLPGDRLAFLYMPLMHSENPDHQARSVACFEAAGLAENARFARHHRDIVRRFGRFPHRNAILGRDSTPEELQYLASEQAFRG